MTERGTALLRVRALLAGALVLGLGGSVTLASWTDTEYAAGSFGASSFQTESNVTKALRRLGSVEQQRAVTRHAGV